MRAIDAFMNPVTQEFTPVFQTFYDAIGEAGCPNYDCNEAADCFIRGLSPQESAAELNARRAEDMSAPLPYDPADRDFSMNG